MFALHSALPRPAGRPHPARQGSTHTHTHTAAGHGTLGRGNAAIDFNRRAVLPPHRRTAAPLTPRCSVAKGRPARHAAGRPSGHARADVKSVFETGKRSFSGEKIRCFCEKLQYFKILIRLKKKVSYIFFYFLSLRNHLQVVIYFFPSLVSPPRPADGGRPIDTSPTLLYCFEPDGHGAQGCRAARPALR